MVKNVGLVHNSSKNNEFLFLVPSAIPSNESVRFLIWIESFVFTGSVVPIAFRFMVRSKFYNGASLTLIKSFFFWNFLILFFFVESTFSVFLIRGSWFVYSNMQPYMDEFGILMLYYNTFYEMTHRPLHSRILYHWYPFSIVLSPLHLSVYSYCFTTNNLNFLFQLL